MSRDTWGKMMGAPDNHRQFVMAGDGSLAKVERRRVHRAVDKWMAAAGPFFPPAACRAIRHTQRLWDAQPTLGRLTPTMTARQSRVAALTKIGSTPTHKPSWKGLPGGSSLHTGGCMKALCAMGLL